MRGSFHAPELDPEFFPGQYYGHIIGEDFLGGWFALDRIMIVRLFMAAVLIILFLLAFRKPQLVPKGLQNFGELAVDFVRCRSPKTSWARKKAADSCR